jgi:hypothetical protein
MSGIKGRKVLHGYRGRPQKSQASLGVEDGAGKEIILLGVTMGTQTAAGNPLATKVTHRLFHKCG